MVLANHLAPQPLVALVVNPLLVGLQFALEVIPDIGRQLFVLVFEKAFDRSDTLLDLTKVAIVDLLGGLLTLCNVLGVESVVGVSGFVLVLMLVLVLALVFVLSLVSIDVRALGLFERSLAHCRGVLE